MRSFLFSLAFLSSLLSLAGCGREVGDVTQVDFIERESLSGTVSVIETFPKDNAVDVPTDATISVTYSGPLNSRSALDFVNFRVEDSFGQQVEGRIRISDDNRTVTFEPQRFGRSTLFHGETTYVVKTRFMRDSLDRLVGPLSFQFRTRELGEGTGDFKVKKIFPEDRFIWPGQTIKVQFTEEVEPPAQGDTCNDFYWNDAIRLKYIRLRNEENETEFGALQGVICIRRSSDTGLLDTLEFTPKSIEDLVPGLSWLDIEIRPTETLRSASSLEKLAALKTESKQVFPTVQTIVTTLGSIFSFAN